jgi:SOS-response transcriptional repressor LexA
VKDKTKRGDAPTKRQAAVLEIIREFHRKNGYCPSVRDIMRAMGASSTNAITCHIRPLIAKGLLLAPPRLSRAMTVPGEPTQQDMRNAVKLAIASVVDVDWQSIPDTTVDAFAQRAKAIREGQRL